MLSKKAADDYGSKTVWFWHGAGCGKTKTIVARAAYLIDQGLPANQIQILTFTRRAASEIVARVEQHVSRHKPKVSVHPLFTPFCMYLLRRNPQAFGFNPI
ncbi:UvrD-helicase domain-containing protein [Acinetobacter baumannii]